MNWLNHIADQLSSGRRSKVLSGALLLLSIAVIAQILISKWSLLTSYRWQIQPVWLLFATLFFIIDLLLASWAWHLLVARLGNYNNLRHNVKICWYANLARRVPSPVWYIASRAFLYEKVGVSKVTTSLLSTIELAFFLISGLVTTLLTLPFWVISDELANAISRSWFLFIIFPFSMLLVHPRVLEKVLQKLSRQVPAQRLRWQDTAIWLVLYVFIWIVGALVLFSVINLFHPLSLTRLVIVIGIWALAGSVSLVGALTISGIGLREVSLILLLTQLVPAPVNLVTAIAIRLLWLTGELLSSLISLKL